MYRIIIIFCISFLSVSFLRAEKMPDSFESETIDISSTYSFLDDLIQPKDEFETTKEYSERIKEIFANSSLFNGNPDKFFYVPLEDVEFTYNADKQEGTFKDNHFKNLSNYIFNSPNMYCFTLEKPRSDSSEGKEVDVIVFQNNSDEIIKPFWSKQMDVTTAKKVKQNFKAIVRFNIIPQVNAEKLVLFQKKNLKGLYVQSVSLIFYDKDSKEIYYIIDLSTYKNPEKEAIEKKKKERTQKTMEFFQNWETPEGTFFGKYIKTQKDIAFFEKEDGTEVQVNLDDLSPQYQDLIKLAQTFKRVKTALLKPRMWDSESKKKYKATFVKLAPHPADYRKKVLYVYLRLDDGKGRVIPLSRLSTRDKKWLENTYNEFLKAKEHYEKKYSVKLLEE